MYGTDLFQRLLDLKTSDIYHMFWEQKDDAELLKHNDQHCFSDTVTHVWHLIHWPEPNTTWHPVSPSNSSAHFVQRKQWQNTAGIVLLKSFPSSMQKFLHPNILKIRFLTLKKRKYWTNWEEHIGNVIRIFISSFLWTVIAFTSPWC